jgi:hypothetical protein
MKSNGIVVKQRPLPTSASTLTSNASSALQELLVSAAHGHDVARETRRRRRRLWRDLVEQVDSLEGWILKHLREHVDQL